MQHLRTGKLYSSLQQPHAHARSGCLGLRAAAAAPHLVQNLVLLNPATSFGGSLGGLSSFISGSNLLALFPKDLYTTAQTVMMPLLVRACFGECWGNDAAACSRFSKMTCT